MNSVRKGMLSLVLVSVALIAASCGKDTEQQESNLLKYVPADTPFVVANQGQLSDELFEKLEPHIDRIMVAYRKMMRMTVEFAQQEESDTPRNDDSLQKAAAIIDELDLLLSIDGLRSAGIDRESRFVLFGNGLLPVLRISLTDSALMEAAIARMETNAGEKLATAGVGGLTYRYAGDGEWRVILAIMEDELVLTFAPNPVADDQLEVILGLTLPGENIEASGVLDDLSEQYGFEDFIVGLIDVEKIVATFLDEPTGINALVLGASDIESEQLDDVCKAEIRLLAGVMPRMVGGYTELSTESVSSKGVFEFRPDIAAGLTTFGNAVPGLGLSQGKLGSFGMSFDLLAMREFYAAQLDAIEAEPFECAMFADMQEGVAEGRELLNQPIPPIAYGFQGFLAVIDDIEGADIQNDIPPTSIDVRLLVSTDNAEGLLAMGAMFSPELAALNLQPGDDPVRLDLPIAATTGQEIFAAISDNAIALSAGEGMEDGLAAMLNAPLREPPPIMSFDIDSASYFDFVSSSFDANADSGDAPPPEFLEAIKEMMLVPRDIFSRFGADVQFTENGIEFVSSAKLKE